ncbi:MAG: hypothetical protein A3D92_24880 [Bacteroidetes bacterium RIFCSPHIGHO2_02_FULL_44_7]|nr:MAG: hypothetical protein A3D92_24880 [Bacteroidetes bacterium RIFCSPHIGHO2_02_FULL_44_7]
MATLSYGQKKYIKKNQKAPVISYGDSLIYARGLHNDSLRIFIGNSDGSVYYYHLGKQKSQLIFKMPEVDEIRDIEKSGNALIAMHSGDNGKLAIIQLDGGVKMLMLPEWKGVFLDGLDILDKRAFLMGDPVAGKFSLFHSADGGYSWERCAGEVSAADGEAGFAASGTNVQILNDSTYVFISGGLKSRFFKSSDNGRTWTAVDMPYYPGESAGGYSLCFANDSVGVIVGGDYRDVDLGKNSCFFTKDGGKSWYNSQKTVRGYRSCVFYANQVFYSCGTNGIDFSVDGGQEWIPFADGNYFTLGATKDALIATTKNGSFQLFDLIEVK